MSSTRLARSIWRYGWISGSRYVFYFRERCKKLVRMYR